MKLIFDIETDGLDATKVHSLVVKDVDTGKTFSCSENLFDGGYPIRDGLAWLEMADVLIGHNIIKYDLPTLRRLYPSFNPKGLVRDTLTISRLIWTDIENEDHRRRDRGLEFPGTLIGSHSLKAWGYRLGVLKGIFNEETDWKTWTPQMQAYCEQDVSVTDALWKLIEKQQYREQAIQLEHDFQDLIYLQEQHGFRFNEPEAGKLAATLLARKEELTAELQKAVPARREEMKTPEYWAAISAFGEESFRAATKTGLMAEVKRNHCKPNTFTYKPGPNKVKLHPFNPGSRDQCAAYLVSQGWKPVKKTETGKPQVDETTLAGLTFPAAPLLREYFIVTKLLGQLAEGDNAWLRLSRKGRMHGSVITNGAITGRCTHRNPNMTQVPGVGSPYGAECRGLFMADEGHVLVGVDAASLEARILAHYLAKWDGGEYGKIVTTGDIHAHNRAALGLPETKEARGIAKVFLYAFVYGAGDFKLGITAGYPENQAKRAGASLRAKFLKNIPALAKLKAAVDSAIGKGYLLGIDGRRLHVRSQHAALNVLIQSCGAVAMKRAAVLLYQTLISKGLQFGKDFAFVVNVHDEFQLSVRPQLADEVAELGKQAIRDAGQSFGLRCPLDGEAKIGPDWKSTH